MLVSVFTMSLGYIGAARAFIAIVLIAGVAEFHWVQVVYSRFPVLHLRDEMRSEVGKSMQGAESAECSQGSQVSSSTPVQRPQRGLVAEWAVWREFASIPVFFSRSEVSTLSATGLD